MKFRTIMALAGCLALASTTVSGDDTPSTGSAAATMSGTASPFYVRYVTAAARDFLALLDEDQRRQAVADFDSPKRVTGRDQARTPAFCAVLAWCVGWGLPQCSLTYDQRRALWRLLTAALSDSGQQTVRAILNKQRIIGELEDVGDSNFVGQMASQCSTVALDTVFDAPDDCLYAIGESEEVAGSDTEDECGPDTGTQTSADCAADRKPAPDYVAVGGLAPSRDAGGYTHAWSWPNGAPGMQIRHEQFCDVAISFFGEPESDRWAFRFEGHHLTINLTFERDAESGEYRVHATPLFLGSFPIIVPPSPHPDDLAWQMTWVASQEFMRGPLDHARRFVAAVPLAVRQSAFVEASQFGQAPPLTTKIFPNWLLTSTLINPAQPLPVASATFSTDDLDETARWHLRLLFRRYFDTLHPAIGDAYKTALDRIIAEGSETSMLWAGDQPDSPNGILFVHIAVGPLLLELSADNQWSTQHRAVPRVNHLHSMLRDLSFRWDYDASLRSPATDHHGMSPSADPTGAQ